MTITSTRDHAVLCTWCRKPTMNDNAVCCNVGCQHADLFNRQRRAEALATAAKLAVGDRVRFVGLNAQAWETTGTIDRVGGDLAFVVWDSDPYAHPRPLHVSQVEAVGCECGMPTIDEAPETGGPTVICRACGLPVVES